MGKFYPSRGVYPVWQTPLLPYKRDQIKMRDYVERRVTLPTWVGKQALI